MYYYVNVCIVYVKWPLILLSIWNWCDSFIHHFIINIGTTMQTLAWMFFSFHFHSGPGSRLFLFWSA